MSASAFAVLLWQLADLLAWIPWPLSGRRPLFLSGDYRDGFPICRGWRDRAQRALKSWALKLRTGGCTDLS